MNLRLHACLGLGLALAACEKAKQVKSPASENPDIPRIVRKERPPRTDVREDLRAALTVAREIESPGEREKAIAKVAWDALELDPDLARDAMDQLPPDGAGRIRLIQHVSMRMAERDPEEALRWADTLGTENEKAAAIGHIALVLADTEPERAANLLSESGVAGRLFDVVAVQVLARWAARSPASAAAWVAVFPPGKSREAGLKSVISAWTHTDADAAISWMATIEDPAVRKETALAIAAALLKQPEDIRDNWLTRADPNIREEIQAQRETARTEAGMIDPPPSE